MASVNKVILVGNLGSDPEVKYTPSGTAVANFTIATTDRFTSRDGERQERTEWHRIVAWDRLAEICGEYLTKGKPVYIEGALKTRSWEDREGNKRYTTEIVARNMQMLGSRGSGGENPAPAPPSEKLPDDDVSFEGDKFSTEDDIPF